MWSRVTLTLSQTVMESSRYYNASTQYLKIGARKLKIATFSIVWVAAAYICVSCFSAWQARSTGVEGSSCNDVWGTKRMVVFPIYSGPLLHSSRIRTGVEYGSATAAELGRMCHSSRAQEPYGTRRGMASTTWQEGYVKMAGSMATM